MVHKFDSSDLIDRQHVETCWWGPDEIVEVEKRTSPPLFHVEPVVHFYEMRIQNGNNQTQVHRRLVFSSNSSCNSNEDCCVKQVVFFFYSKTLLIKEKHYLNNEPFNTINECECTCKHSSSQRILQLALAIKTKE